MKDKTMPPAQYQKAVKKTSRQFRAKLNQSCPAGHNGSECMFMQLED